MKAPSQCEPRVSIIITAYNYGHTLAEAISSACNQDYPHLEILVLDNASTDHTSEVVQPFLSDPRVRYIRNPINIGATRNHNRGIIESHGDYLNFLSADDRMSPNQISSMLNYLDTHPDIDIAYSEISTMDAAGTYTGQRHSLVPAGHKGLTDQFALWLTYGCYAAFETMLIPRWVFGLYGLLDEMLTGADFECMIRWAAQGVRFGFHPVAYLHYRIHSNQDSGGERFMASGKALAEYLYILNKHLKPQTHHLIHGYEYRINRHIQAKLELAKQFGYQESAATQRAIHETSESINRIRDTNHALAPERCSVLIFADDSQEHVERSLRSLLKQSFQQWEALILYPPLAPVADYSNLPANIRVIHLTEVIPKGQALNVGLHLAGGDFTTFLHAGNTFPEDHLARLQWAFTHHDLEAYLSPTVLVIHEGLQEFRTPIFNDFGNIDKSLIAPNCPLEALAVRRDGFDRCNTFVQEINLLNEWEILLRYHPALTLGALTNSHVQVHEEVGVPNRYALNPSLLATFEQIYRSSRIHDQRVSKLRARYLSGLEGRIAVLGSTFWSRAEHLAWYDAYNADWLFGEANSASEVRSGVLAESRA